MKDLHPGTIAENVKTAVAVGKFDGLHRGHQLLLERIAAEKENGFVPVVISIDGGAGRKVLLTAREKTAILLKFGIREHFVLALPKIRDMSADDFIREILVEKLHAGVVVSGTDFHFGKGRSGDASGLEKAGRTCGFTTAVYEKISYDGADISSGRIREALERGESAAVREMLGFPYFAHGSLEETSDGTVSYLVAPEKLLPKSGVYTLSVKREKGAFEIRAKVDAEAGKIVISDSARALRKSELFSFC